MRIRTLLSFLFFIGFVNAQDFNTNKIDPSLLANANAVIRLHDISFEVSDTDRAVSSSHLVVTILSPGGEELAEMKNFYDVFSKITDLKGKLYNAQGKLIKKLKSSDFIDYSAVSNSSLYDDNRVKYFKPQIGQYPYTVEYEWTEKLSGILTYPQWMPQDDYDVSVERSTYTLTLPLHWKFHFKILNNDTLKPTVTETSETKAWHFTIEKLPAMEQEPLSTGLRTFNTIVYTVPDYFKLDGHTGSNANWNAFGQWVARLNDQPNKLSEKTLAKLAELQKTSTDRTSLIRSVYEYMQSRTRYVSIQLGIGGFKPFDASVVDKYGYGDCKALSNYTKVLLQNVGIESIYTLVHAGGWGTDILQNETFTQFNHAIVCVPNGKDSIWLECTAQMNPFGYLGMFTDNRHVLLINPEGGKLVRTPVYMASQNTLTKKIEVWLSADGNARTSVTSQYAGLEYDNVVSYFYRTPEEQKERLYKEINLPSFTIAGFSLAENKQPIPVVTLKLQLNVTKYATPMGPRLLFPLAILSNPIHLPSHSKERRTNFRLRYAYTHSDTIIYHLPEGYRTEFLPPPAAFDTEYGTYQLSSILSADSTSLTCIRRVIIAAGVHSPEKYKDLGAFLKNMDHKDYAKVALVKKTGN